MQPTETELALWANQVMVDCLIEANGDVNVGLAAAAYILETQSIPLAVDPRGHHHRGKGGAQGGQFTSPGVGEGDIGPATGHPKTAGGKGGQSSQSRSGGSGTVRQSNAAGQGVEGAPGAASDAGADKGGQAQAQQTDIGTGGSVQRAPKEQSAAIARIDKLSSWANRTGKSYISMWLGDLKSHVNKFGVEHSLKSMEREAPTGGKREPVVYDPGEEYPQDWNEYVRGYLNHYGITSLYDLPKASKPMDTSSSGDTVGLRHTTDAVLPEGVPTKADADGLVWFFDGPGYGSYGKHEYKLSIPKDKLLDLDDLEHPEILKEYLATYKSRSKQKEHEFATKKGFWAIKRGQDIAMTPERAKALMQLNAQPPKQKVISTLTPKARESQEEPAYPEHTQIAFRPAESGLTDKLKEAKHIPGLESSEDLNVIIGAPVTHINDSVVKTLDDRYGKDAWIIKPYTGDAFAGHGIFFPERVEEFQKQQKELMWDAERSLASTGLSMVKDQKTGVVSGVQNEQGDYFNLDSPEYAKLAQTNHALANLSIAHMRGATKGIPLLDREGMVTGKGYMAQPAYQAISQAEKASRAEGAPYAHTEARVHVITNKGQAQVVPYGTFYKRRPFPIVFQDNDSREIERVAHEAVMNVPESERQGHVYAPDVIKTPQGYKVVELNPSNEIGSSGHLGSNPLIIDAYVSALQGHKPGFAQFIERVLTKKGAKSSEAALSMFFAFDIYNKQAQGILNRALKAARGLSTQARKDLEKALKKGPTDSGEAILKFIDKYRLQLSRLLSTTQLASLLEGAREVAIGLPTLATFPGAVPPPPSLEPKEAVKLVEKIAKLRDEARARAIYNLPEDQQTYVQQSILAEEASTPIVPPAFTPPSPPEGSPEEIHFPTIENAVKHLSEKNVLTRERFDAVDAATKAKSFTVASVDAEETLTKIRDELAENVRTGASFEKFKENVLDAVDQGTFLSDAHMETVFRTNVQSAFSDGQMAVLNHPLVRSGFPYAVYDSIHDNRVRDEHLALDTLGIDGTNIYRINDPVFQLFRPPWDYNCRCSWIPITVRQASESGIAEAQDWLETGIEPVPPAFVPMPDFQPPAGFRRTIESTPLSIQLSMQSLLYFSLKEDDKPEEETETSLLYGQSDGASPATGGATDTARDPTPGRRVTRVGRRRFDYKRKTTKNKIKKKSKRKWVYSPALSVDPYGHEHVESGPKGGQFTPRGTGGSPASKGPQRVVSPQPSSGVIQPVQPKTITFKKGADRDPSIVIVKRPIHESTKDILTGIASLVKSGEAINTANGRRVTLPALYSVLANSKGVKNYPVRQFVSDLITVCRSSANLNTATLKVEPAVIEASKNPKKSIFFPHNVNLPLGEGSYYQAVTFNNSNMNEFWKIMNQQPEPQVGLSVDPRGHHHRGKGEQGGQFTSPGIGEGNVPIEERHTVRNPAAAKDAARAHRRIRRGSSQGGTEGVPKTDTGAAQTIQPAQPVTDPRLEGTAGFTRARELFANINSLRGLASSGDPEYMSHLMEHQKRVLKTARQTGTFVKKTKFANIINSSEDVGGGEHEVYEDVINNRYYKFTRSSMNAGFGLDDDVHQYLQRLETASKLWPSLGYKFEGITKSEGEEYKGRIIGRGRPQVVISMNRIEGDHPEQEEIHQWFLNNGWEIASTPFVPSKDMPNRRLKKGDRAFLDWRDPQSGTVVGDAHIGNFIKTKSGNLAPIDVTITLGPSGPQPPTHRTQAPKQE